MARSKRRGMRVALFQKIGHALRRIAAPTDRQASAQSIYYCYRAILGRNPTKQEVTYWSRSISVHRITIAQLIDTFECSEEAKQHRRSIEQKLTTNSERYIHKLSIEGSYIYISTDDTFVGLALSRDGHYEPAVTQLITNQLKPGATFIDVGANIGYFSLLAARLVGTSGRVFCFEPNIRNCALLQLSKLENQYHTIEILPFAASDTTSNAVLHMSGSNGSIISDSELASLGTPLSEHTTRWPSEFMRIQTVTIDETLRAVDRIDLMKIDVEGTEPFVLAGMLATIARHRPVIISEFAPTAIQRATQQAPAAYLQTLRELGYELHLLTNEGITTLPHEYHDLLRQCFTTGNDHIDIVCYPTTPLTPTP